MSINCTLCGLPIKESFSTTIFYNDGSEERLQNTIVPEDEMRAVVIYSHNNCSFVEPSLRERFNNIRKSPTSHDRDIKSDRDVDKYIKENFEVVFDQNRFLKVLPKVK